MPEITQAERQMRGYLDYLAVERGASAHTVNAYRRDLRKYASFLSHRGISRLDAVSESDITGFVAWLQDGDSGHRALSAASATRALVAVRSLHSFQVREGFVEASPAAQVHPPRLARRLPKALSLAQVEAILSTPDPSTVTGLRDQALLELLYGTGARIAEVVAIDVDEARAFLADPDVGLRLFGKGRKERIVPVGSFARSAVEAWLVRGRPVFAERASQGGPALLLNSLGRRLSRQSAWQILSTAGERAGIVEPISPHTLRHSFATHLLDGGADIRVVQELLGHASVATTQIYTKVTAEHLREVFLSSHPRAR